MSDQVIAGIQRFKTIDNAIRKQAYVEKSLRPCWRWAEDFRIMPEGVTSDPGPYDIDLTPYLKEPQEEFDNPENYVVCLQMASGLGKTECINNHIGRNLHETPCFMLMNYPTIDSGTKFRKKQLNPMLDSSPCFDDIVPPPRSKDSQNTILSLSTTTGANLSIIGANSPSGYRQVRAQRVYADEIDAMDNTEEGDPIELLFKRCRTYSNATRILTSTPTIKGLSRIESFYLRSDQRKFFVQSPYSGKWHVLAWENVKWDSEIDPKTKEKRHLPKTAYYQDPDTDDRWTDADRRKAIMNGEWRATAPFTGIRGYHLSALNMLFKHDNSFVSIFHQWAQEFLDANAQGYEAIQVWKNTFLAETHEEDAEVLNVNEIFARRESYEKIPGKAVAMTAGGDVQGDRLEFTFYGWGPGFECWGAQHVVIPASLDSPQITDLVYSALSKRFPHESGNTMGVDLALIDVQYRTEDVLRLCKRLRQRGINIYGVRGVGSEGVDRPPYVEPKPRLNNTLRFPVYHIGTDAGKDILYSKIQLTEGIGKIHFTDLESAGFDEEFYNQILSEKQFTKYSRGRPFKAYRPTEGVRNEPVDTHNYARAAIVALDPNFEILKERYRPRNPANDIPVPKKKSSFRRSTSRIKRR